MASRGAPVDFKEKIDSVGYRYRSKWISSEVVSPKSYDRIYRRDSTYVRWTNAYPTSPKTCLVKFNHDSLYAIGGKLTIEARGALIHVDNINNAFKVNSDSITPQGDTIRHKILIDSDPSNAEFSTRLGTDRIRAVAWQEYAGSRDARHCNNPPNTYNPRWNHYWDNRIYAGATCRDSLTPCENTGWLDTGIMQIIRRERRTPGGWETHFKASNSIPSGYIPVSWDSLAWNWRICINNGRYIHDVYMPTKFTPEQDSFPDSCSFADCDTFPKNKNKEDLKAYGYHRGENRMKEVINDDAWKLYIADDSEPQEYSVYVQNVRKYYYRKPW